MIPAIIGVFGMFFWKETPYFYFTKNKEKEAIEVFNYIASVNKMEQGRISLLPDV